MMLPRFAYKKAKDIPAAIALYEDAGGGARYLAGGTDLVPLLKLRLNTPSVLIDIKGIPEMMKISTQGGHLCIGANVTLFDLKRHPMVKDTFGALRESLEATSCETLQMRGTIGGNLLQNTRCLFYNQSLNWRTARGFCAKMGGETCNVVPKAAACFSNYCSDNASSLLSLAAQVKLAGPGGERTLPLGEIYSGDGRTPFTLSPGEILTEILLPLETSPGAYEKLRVRNAVDYPLLGVAVTIEGNMARVCVGGIGAAPRVLVQKDFEEGLVKETAREAGREVRPVANATLSPAYRKRMVPVLTERAIKRALKEKRR